MGYIRNGFIHVHHNKPILAIKVEYTLDPILDLRPLCPNCHAIAHLRQEPYSIEEIKDMITGSAHETEKSYAKPLEWFLAAHSVDLPYPAIRRWPEKRQIRVLFGID